MKNKNLNGERKCKVCGCTEDDCRQCIEKTGSPCVWVEADLCSACSAYISKNPSAKILRDLLPDKKGVV